MHKPAEPRTIASGVERDLLGRRGKRPGDLEAALLAEVEAQLTRRTQAIRVVGPERRAGGAVADRAEVMAAEEAALTRDFRGRYPTVAWTPPGHGTIKACSPPWRERESRKTQHFRDNSFSLL